MDPCFDKEKVAWYCGLQKLPFVPFAAIKEKMAWYSGFQKVLFGPFAAIDGHQPLMATLTLDYR